MSRDYHNQKNKKILEIAKELTKAGWPAQPYNSGGYVMVVAVYEPSKAAKMETSSGQYKYCAFVGDSDGPWGMDLFDEQGDYLVSHDLDQKNIVEDISIRLKAHFQALKNKG